MSKGELGRVDAGQLMRVSYVKQSGCGNGTGRIEVSAKRDSSTFDRTLGQLERVQRMRLGQPVLPKLEVQHSVSWRKERASRATLPAPQPIEEQMTFC